MKRLKQLNRLFQHYGHGPMKVERFGPKLGFAVTSDDESVSFSIMPAGECESFMEDLDGNVYVDSRQPAFNVSRDCNTYEADVVRKVKWSAVVGRIAQNLADHQLHDLLDEVLEVHR